MRRGNPVTGPDGTEYPSQSAAARALGVNHETIRIHLRRYGNLDRIHCWMVPVSWNGREYRSIADAAKAAGRATNTAVAHLNRHGNLDRLGVGPVGPVGNDFHAMPIQLGPHWFPSRKAAAEALGIHPSTLSKARRDDAPATMKDRLYAAIMAYDAKSRRAA